MNRDKIYLVLTGDIKGSSQVENRQGLTNSLLDLCAAVNRYFSVNIIAPFKVVSGDGMQGLLKTDTNIMLLAHYIRAKIHPYFMRLGFGLGELSTQLNDDVSLMDGKCFQYAGEAVEYCKDNDLWAYLRSEEADTDKNYDALFFLQQMYYQRLNPQQKKLVRAYFVLFVEEGVVNQLKLQEVVRIQQANISRTLKTIRLNYFIRQILTSSKI